MSILCKIHKNTRTKSWKKPVFFCFFFEARLIGIFDSRIDQPSSATEGESRQELKSGSIVENDRSTDRQGQKPSFGKLLVGPAL
jgi:hypothetical protein